MRRRIERGLTLVELMISLVLALVVILAAATALRVARRGFATVDAMGQLQDNARFAVELIQRVASQSGYLNDGYAVQTRPRDFPLADAPQTPGGVQGYDDALAPDGAPDLRSLPGPARPGTPQSASARDEGPGSFRWLGSWRPGVPAGARRPPHARPAGSWWPTPPR